MPVAEIKKFWEQTRAALDEVEMNAKVGPVEESDVFTTEGLVKTFALNQVTLTSFEGRRIRAWYTIPIGKPPSRGWPAIMVTPGYGGTQLLPQHLVQYGYATLSLYPRGQGESLKEWKLEKDTKLVYNLPDRDSYYYRGAYMDCVRGIDFLSSRGEVDNQRLGAWGFSQGGGLTLATAALDHRVSAAVAGVPWMCSLPLAAEVGSAPYVELRDFLAEHPEQRDQSLATLAYYDQLNLADDIVCPTLVGCGAIDEVHPIYTIMPVFEKIRSMKSMITYPDLEHEYRTDFTAHGLAWMDRYMR